MNAHPNEFDKKRIERALAQRTRYRYVAPRVSFVADGYKVESPCCSRNIDAAGGVIDIALLEYAADEPRWRLYGKDHETGQWCLVARFARLQDALGRLASDAERRFWQ